MWKSARVWYNKLEVCDVHIAFTTLRVSWSHWALCVVLCTLCLKLNGGRAAQSSLDRDFTNTCTISRAHQRNKALTFHTRFGFTYRLGPTRKWGNTVIHGRGNIRDTPFYLSFFLSFFICSSRSVRDATVLMRVWFITRIQISMVKAHCERILSAGTQFARARQWDSRLHFLCPI